MTFLITTDLHLSSRPKDSYRFGLFQWLAKQQKKYDAQGIFILGDLTEDKDCHAATLVNRTVDEMTGLRPPIYIDRGNHDGINPNDPFFRFLSCIDGINFSVEPEWLADWGIAMIPHCRDQDEFDRACGIIKPKATAVMLHNTFEGAMSETGRRLSGLRASLAAFKGSQGVWSGDIHKPQQAGPVTYVGSPYHVRFGDDFEPRVLLIQGKQKRDLHFPCPRKWKLVINDPDEIGKNENLREGDQVKITIQLAREEVVDWAKHKARAIAACKELGVEVYGPTLEVLSSSKKPERTAPEEIASRSPIELVKEYCLREKASSKVKEAGLAIIQEG